jgi:hypothetical protein
MSTPDIEHLRQLIENTLSELGIPGADWSCVRAKSLEQGRFDSRLPQSEVLAVWLADRNELQFHSENGSLLKTVNIGQQASECFGAA